MDYPETSFLYRYVLAGCPGMDIHQIAFQNGGLKPLKFAYDGMILKITWTRFYTSKEAYTVWLDYTAKPNDL
jgi:aminopeptidase N